MAEPTGRREANKQATRAALRSAAKRLFASKGYERTTVRDIAQVANVTERTFYRYFDGKEDLAADEYRAFLSMFKNAILARPPEEPALASVERAARSVAQQATHSGTLWLVSTAPPRARLWRSTTRPLVQLEEAIASALLARPLPRPGAPGALGRPSRSGQSGDSPGPDDVFAAHVIARLSVAAMRSAIIELRARLAAGATVPAAGTADELGDLLARAFAIIATAGRDRSAESAS